MDVVLSDRLKPYIEIAQGLKEYLKGVDVRLVIAGSGETARVLKNSPCGCSVGVGAFASNIVAGSSKKHKICSLIIYPFIGNWHNSCDCGVYAEVPPGLIIDSVVGLIKTPKILVLYSDQAIEPYIERIREEADKKAFVAAVRISSIEELKKKLDILWKDIDVLLFVPDPIFSSEGLIRWLVNQALLHRKLAVGYNRFFLQVGAGVAVTIDYEKTGEETAKLLGSCVGQKKGRWIPAVYRVLFNDKVLKFLGVGR